jgi:hypothetical protein
MVVNVWKAKIESSHCDDGEGLIIHKFKECENTFKRMGIITHIFVTCDLQ